MTDKPRLIDADKLGRFLEEIGSLTARRIEITIAAGLFDPDPPQQPDIQVGERNWQEDMELSERAKGWTFEITFNGAGNIVAEDANYTFAQVIAGDIGIGHAEIILDGLEALPYWLQKVMDLERELEESELVNWKIECEKYKEESILLGAECEGLKYGFALARNRADAAESLIQRKDTEIAVLKRLAEFWESQCSETITHAAETEERLNVKITNLTALLQDKGNNP